MATLSEVTWFAGLFEGEGSFHFSNGRPRRLTIQMTDRDVLDRIQELFGGSIFCPKKQQEHHKQSWIWALYGENSIELAEKMRPYLLSRRGARCDEYIEKFVTRNSLSVKSLAFRDRVRELRTKGMTHKQIAEEVGVGRPYVTHILNGRYDS